MTEEIYPEFEINTEDLSFNITPQTSNHDRNDRLLGIREKLNFYYREFRQCDRQMETERTGVLIQQEEMLLDMIHVANKFVDTLRMFEDNDELKKQTFARDCLQNTYDELKDIMEKWGLEEVPVIGKEYKDVEFKGVAIPEPWEVVAGKKENKKKDMDRNKVSRMIRPLWVWVRDTEVKVLQRGKVNY